jgi:hypothetical protein
MRFIIPTRLIIGGVIASFIGLSIAYASHRTGIYPNVAWRSIAAGGQDYFGINPGLPTYNGNGAMIRPAIRQAVNAWNVTRPYYPYVNEVAWTDSNNHFQFKEFGSTAGGASGFGWVPFRYDANGNCVTNAPPGETCKGEIQIGEFWDYNQVVGGLVHELGHGIGALADHFENPPNCTTIMSSCWQSLTAPTDSDVLSVKTVYGIPHNIRIIKLNGMGDV